MRHHRPRILVTGSSLFFAARLINDLGRRGAAVTAADSLRFSAGKSSRYAARRVLLPSMNRDPGAYLEALITELKSRPYDLLLPTFEEALVLSEYQNELRPHVRLFLPQFSEMFRLHHKPSLHQRCQTLGLPTPPTFKVDHADRLQKVSEQLGFPVVVKLPSANNSVGRTFCDNDQELRQTFSRISADQQRCGGEMPFVQKKIEGDLICTLSFCNQGRKLAEVVYRTLRMFPQAGGTSVHRQSMAHAEISRMTDRLIASSGWSGFLGFDFLVERATGIPYVIDANVRANPAIHLGFCAGLDWSELILDLAKDRKPDSQTASAGINVHTMFMDVAWLLEGLRSGAGGLRRFPQRCREFISPSWKVHSRGDLLATGEFVSAIIMSMQTISAGIKSMINGGQAGQIILEHANYDPATAEAYRLMRASNQPDRIAA